MILRAFLSVMSHYSVFTNETGKLREDQIKFQKFIEDKPVLYGVCRSVEDAIELIESN